MAVYDLEGLRVIDLTKELDPKTETRRLKLDRFNTGGPIPDFHTDMDITSHLGTHCELPYHHNSGWSDAADLPLTTFMGRGVYVDFGEKLEPNSYISKKDLDRELDGKIKKDDIIILDSSYKLEPFTKDTNTELDKRLKINAETAEWLEEKEVKCVGFGDGVSIESSNEDVRPFHTILMQHDIVFLEVLKNLEKLEKSIFFISYSVLPIHGLDSCPVRAYAIEGLVEFS